MKKNYLTPQMKTVKLKARHLLSGSGLGAVGSVSNTEEFEFVDDGIASGSGDR